MQPCNQAAAPSSLLTRLPIIFHDEAAHPPLIPIPCTPPSPRCLPAWLLLLPRPLTPSPRPHRLPAPALLSPSRGCVYDYDGGYGSNPDN